MTEQLPSFVEAVKELERQCDEIGYKPDYIFHATGTGSTQAGIAVGLDLVGWSDVTLIGFSVARSAERGKKVVVDFTNMLADRWNRRTDSETSKYWIETKIIELFLCFIPKNR